MSGCHATTVTDVTAGLTLALTPAVATVRQESHSALAPTAATMQQQGALFGAACPYRAFTPGEQQIT